MPPDATILLTMRASAAILICLLANAAAPADAEEAGSTNLAVNFVPEVLMTQRSGVVSLKIRLGEGGSARIWIADNCAEANQPEANQPEANQPEANQPEATQPDEKSASYRVGESGEYQIPIASLPGRGARVCLTSTDRLTAEAESGQSQASSSETPQASPAQP